MELVFGLPKILKSADPHAGHKLKFRKYLKQKLKNTKFMPFFAFL